MCFGSRGDPKKKNKGHFSQARRTAERAMQQPYFVTIGGGEQVPAELNGRVLELVRATGVFGETIAFVKDDALRERLSQWPVAIVVSEVYSIENEPRLVEDLGFPDRRILTNAYDSVIRDDEQVHRLWEALKDRLVSRRWEVRLPPSFHDPGKVQMFGSLYPRLDSTSTEGKRVWKQSLDVERDPRLRREAKALNRSQHGGIIVCDACEFADDKDGMFDAHHLRPLAVGERESRVDDLAVLCPTCHRWAHAKAEDKLSPVPVDRISTQRSSS